MGDKSSIINIYRGRIRSRFQVPKKSFHVNIHLNPILLKKKKMAKHTIRLRGSAYLVFFTYMSLKVSLRFLTLRNSIHSLILSPRKLTFPYKLSFSPLSGFNDLSKLPVWSLRKKPYYFYLELFVFVFVVVDVQLWIPIHLLPWFYVENRRLRMKSHSL